MRYDPFARGGHPVGVRTASVQDDARGRTLPVEIWYPADDAHAGDDLREETRDRFHVFPALPPSAQDAVRDAAARPGRFPLVLFSHGFGGHRRQSTFLCTHLASHGYLVAAMDHVGNTTQDVLGSLMALPGGGPAPDPVALLAAATDYRPSDVSLVLDRLLDGSAGDLAARIDSERVGMAGHSFGGWTTLAVSGRDPRVRAALALAPAGGAPAAEGDPLPGLLDLAWEREVPTLLVVAERDSLLPLAGMRALFARVRSQRRLAVLANADHQHFCDQVEQTHELMRSLALLAPPALRERMPQLPPIGELCPGLHGHLATRGLGLAHLDAHLREIEAAAQLLSDGASALARHGVAIEIEAP